MMSAKGAEDGEKWRRWLIHALGVLMLLWPAVINRQPFFFPDTTSYIRAADLAVRMVTHEQVRTAWSNNDPAPSQKIAGAAVAAGSRPAHGSDGRDGNPVMSGRSPYFGALLYVGWVTSGFWLFVLAQGIAGWWLIGLALRSFALEGLRPRLIVTTLIGLLTTASFYVGLLLADDLAALGLLAFFVLVAGPTSLSRIERLGLGIILLLSVVSHLTHIVMTLAMTVMLLGYWLLWRRSWTEVKGPIAIGVAATLIGLASVATTGAVVKKALGRPPTLAPLLTARFIVDGPGRDFIAAGCGGKQFTACRIPSNATNSDVYLWSRTPGEGAFLTSDTATRAALSREDKAFATSVFAAYPLRQAGMIVWNTLLQLGQFNSSLLDAGCVARYECSGIVLPPDVRARLQSTPAGRNAWPVRTINLMHSLVVLAALAALAILLPKVLRDQPEFGRRLLLWCSLLGVAMLANAFFGGAISAPQGRYQGRIVWLIPLLALITIARLRAPTLPAPPAAR